MSMHLAPNGKPSKLTHEQWHLVRTPEFKAWFGDWEDDPENASKVIDENGEPLVVYHRSNDNFNVFDKGKNKLSTYGKGLYFTNLKNEYSKKGKYLYQVFLNLKNPLIIDIKNQNFEGEVYELLKFERDFKLGAIIKNPSLRPDDQKVYDLGERTYYVADNSSQIKLADGSNTTFDGNNSDIRYEDGGKLKKPHTILEIAKKHKIKVSEVSKALIKGQKLEREHTKDDEIAKTIAKHHLWESPKYYDKLKQMEKTFAEGGKIVGKNADPNNGKDGGYFDGRSHAKGGIKAYNETNNQPIEVEGGEVIITKRAVADNTKREFEGQMLTNKEILSKINEGGGGVSFKQGGKVDSKENEEENENYTPSQLNKKLFPHAYKKEYKSGGKLSDTISIVNKQLPTLSGFKSSYNGLIVKPIKYLYKDILKEQYGVSFDELPKKIQLGLTLGNQKLIDNYINS
jgi:hypothetical protein